MAVNDTLPESSRRTNPKPSLWTAGRRRRLVRRSALTRSNTTPVLPNVNPNSVTTNPVNNMSPTFARSCPAADTPEELPITPTNPSSPAPSAATESKKKGHGILDVFKAKERAASSETSLTSSPVPTGALSSPKALKTLGIEVEHRKNSSPREGEYAGQTQTDSEDNSAPVLKPLHKSTSLPWLTRKQEADDQQTRSTEEREEEVEGFGPAFWRYKRLRNPNWREANKKALRLMDLIPSLTARPKSSGKDTSGSTTSRFEDQDIDPGYHSDGGTRPRRRASRSSTIANRRSRRRKGAKVLERMSPISETSSARMPAGDDGAELDLISEYDEQHAQPTFPRLRRSITDPLMPQFELKDEDLSTDEGENTEREDEERNDKEFVETTPIYLQETKIQTHEQTPSTIRVKSPLQEVEHVLLNNTEERMKMDAEKYRLQQEHVKMKTDLKDMKRRSILPEDFNLCIDDGQEIDPSANENTEDESDDGICSSIDTDEEPTEHNAQGLTFTRATPDMIKLVDITRQVTIAKFAAGQIKTIDTTPTTRVVQPTQYPKLKIRRPHLDPPLSDGFSIPPSYRSVQYAYERRPKLKLPREQSYRYIEGWIENTITGADRPYSMIDSDVLADRHEDRAPAPPPKDDSPLATPKHYCVQNGHIFRPINLKKTSDDVAFNYLQVSPYLRTPSGIKQYVHVPVQCQNCSNDVREELWECEVSVCRLAVCYTCAVNMEKEWEGRAVNSWEHRSTTI